MRIRNEQMKAFEKAAVVNFELRSVQHLQEQAPKHTAVLGPERTRETVHYGIERAKAYGFVTERGMLIYLDLMFLLCRDFATDPVFPFAPPILNDKTQDEAARSDALLASAKGYLQRVAGPANEYLLAALSRCRKEPLDDRPPGGDPLERWIARRLFGLYPEKCRAAGPQIVLEVIRRALETAKRSGFTSDRGLFLIAALAFLLGTAFDRDPLFAWAADALKAPGSEADRIKRLHGAALTALDHWTAGT